MHSRDLELDPQGNSQLAMILTTHLATFGLGVVSFKEINQVFSNEFMKLNPNLKAFRLVESKLGNLGNVLLILQDRVAEDLKFYFFQTESHRPV